MLDNVVQCFLLFFPIVSLFTLIAVHTVHGFSIIPLPHPQQQSAQSNTDNGQFAVHLINTDQTKETHLPMMAPDNNSDDQFMKRQSVNIFNEPDNNVRQPFDNIAPQYIGPNYLTPPQSSQQNEPDHLSPRISFPLGSNAMDRNLHTAFHGLINHKDKDSKPSQQDTISDFISEKVMKKYNIKNYLLTKILGAKHELDEGEGGFFNSHHLKRHGTAGVAAKVLGELIGLKLKASIEKVGKSFGEYAKELTARNIVNFGNVFSRMLKLNK